MYRKGSFNHRRQVLESSIIMTPLIDIIFLVLIFFMVNNNPALRLFGVSTPGMSSLPPQEREPRALAVHLRKDGVYVLSLVGSEEDEGGKAWTRQGTWRGPSPGGVNGDIKTALREERDLKGFSEVQLRADRGLTYGEVIAVCDFLVGLDLTLALDVSGGLSGLGDELLPDSE